MTSSFTGFSELGFLWALLKTKKNNKECVGIEYADNAYVYVSLDQFSLIHKYVGSRKNQKFLPWEQKNGEQGLKKPEKK